MQVKTKKYIDYSRIGVYNIGIRKKGGRAVMIRVPEYFVKFKCIADRCQDSCCIGWEIDVDDASRAKYEALYTDLGREIVEKTSHGCFPLQKNGRCAFLDERGLCRIISALGDGYLCDICREHPRYYGVGDGIIEGGLGLGCEEAARMILELSSLPKLIEIERDVPYSDEDELADVSAVFRERLYGVIFTDDIRTVASTYAAYSRLADDVAFDVSSSGERTEVPSVKAEAFGMSAIEETYRGALDCIDECEALTDRWCSLLSLAREVETEKALDRLDKMRGLLYYFTHRYVREGVEDMTLAARIAFALTSAMTVAALSTVMEGDRPDILAAVEYSKNIEYSTENVEYVLDNIFL